MRLGLCGPFFIPVCDHGYFSRCRFYFCCCRGVGFSGEAFKDFAPPASTASALLMRGADDYFLTWSLRYQLQTCTGGITLRDRSQQASISNLQQTQRRTYASTVQVGPHRAFFQPNVWLQMGVVRQSITLTRKPPTDVNHCTVSWRRHSTPHLIAPEQEAQYYTVSSRLHSTPHLISAEQRMLYSAVSCRNHFAPDLARKLRLCTNYEEFITRKILFRLRNILHCVASHDQARLTVRPRMILTRSWDVLYKASYDVQGEEVERAFSWCWSTLLHQKRAMTSFKIKNTFICTVLAWTSHLWCTTQSCFQQTSWSYFLESDTSSVIKSIDMGTAFLVKVRPILMHMRLICRPLLLPLCTGTAM